MQKVDFRNNFPPFWDFSIEIVLATRGFATRGFPIPPNIRKLPGLPVLSYQKLIFHYHFVWKLKIFIL